MSVRFGLSLFKLTYNGKVNCKMDSTSFIFLLHLYQRVKAKEF